MKNRKTYIPITLAELTNVTQSISTSLEQIEYLAVNILFCLHFCLHLSIQPLSNWGSSLKS